MSHHSKMQLFLSIPNYQHSRVIFKLKSFRQWRRCQHLRIDGKAIPRSKGNTMTTKQHEVSLPVSRPDHSRLPLGSRVVNRPRCYQSPSPGSSHSTPGQSLSLHGDEDGRHTPAWHASLRGKGNSGLESSHC